MELKSTIGLNHEIRNAVDHLEKQPWFTYFHAIRTRITHRMPISPQARFTIAKDIARQFHFCYLPDDPKVPYPTFEKKIDIVCESKKWLEGVLGFTEDVCKVLIDLMSM
jgi:hypothetical protein